MVLRRVAVVLLCQVLWIGTARTDEPKAPKPHVLIPSVTPVRTTQRPLIDGKGDEAVWSLAPSTVVMAATTAEAVPVTVRACQFEDVYVLLLSWPDAAADRGGTDPAAPGVRLLGDGLSLAWGRDVDAEGMLSPTFPGSVDAVTFDASAPPSKVARPEGVWADGTWTVELMQSMSPGVQDPAAGDVRRGAFTLSVANFAQGLLAASGPVRIRAGRSPMRRDFESDAPGGAAAGFLSALAGKGKPPSWVVRADEVRKSNVLVQEAQDQENDRYPLVLMEGFEATDVDLSVRFHARKGFKDQGAGIVWRVKDAGNHYLLRANVLEQNVVIFKMEDNLRVDLPAVGHESDYGVAVKFDARSWHTLRAVVTGDRFQAYLDGQLLFEVVDSTFTGKGGVGLWTKSDSVMAFDDVLAVSLDAPPGK
jgi:hypothetical protein